MTNDNLSNGEKREDRIGDLEGDPTLELNTSDFENFYRDLPGGANRELIDSLVSNGNISDEILRKQCYHNHMDGSIKYLGENVEEIKQVMEQFSDLARQRYVEASKDEERRDGVRENVGDFINWMYEQPFIQKLYRELREVYSHRYIVSGSDNELSELMAEHYKSE